MKVINTKIPGLIIIEPKVFGDSRGYFLELWQEERYKNAGISDRFCQDNLSFSRRDVLRGLHFQNPNAQGKLVYVLEGEVFDVAVDIRLGSPTFGEWVGATLSDENKRQFYVPEGFAHGFCVISETVLFAYKCTEKYNPSAEHTIQWNDPDIAITWPINQPSLSSKDAIAFRLCELKEDILPKYRE